jgi:uncharacterized protein YnzC (UPF0291/DUF896 family)
VPVVELAEFKEARRDLLRRFRQDVEKAVMKAASIDDDGLRDEFLRQTKDAFADQIDEIHRRMTERRWRKVSAGAVAGVVGGGVVLADGVTTGGALTISGASLGLVSAVYSACEGKVSKVDLLGQPMAYAALARRRFA